MRPPRPPRPGTAPATGSSRRSEAAEAAERRSAVAEADVERQREAYGDALVTSYQLAPGLTALGAIAESDGIET